MVRVGLFVALTFSAMALAVLTARAAADQDPRPILVSRHLAAAEGLRVGQVVRLSSSASGTGARPFVIQGLFEPTPDPLRLGTAPRTIRMHLPDLLEFTRDPGMPAGSESVDRISIQLADPADAAAFSRDVAARMPGLTAQPAVGASASRGPFVVLRRFHLAIALVTIIAATVFLLALTVMLVDERRPTVGVLRLIGLPRRRIVAQLFVEGTLVATAGAVFGLLMALASEPLINRFFQWRYDTALVFVSITPSVGALSAAIAVPLGVVATVGASYALLRSNVLRLARR